MTTKSLVVKVEGLLVNSGVRWAIISWIIAARLEELNAIVPAPGVWEGSTFTVHA